jgi:hypothetical protein
MAAQPGRGNQSYAYAAAAIVIAAIMISVTILVSSTFNTAVTKTNTLTTTSTVTITTMMTTTTTTKTTTTILAAQLLSKSWGQWIFDVAISATSVRVGQAILVSGTVTYVGQNNITGLQVQVNPAIGVDVYNSSGSWVWGNAVGMVTVDLNDTIHHGDTLTGKAYIPITNTALGYPWSPGVYAMEIEPTLHPDVWNASHGDPLLTWANFTVLADSS